MGRDQGGARGAWGGRAAYGDDQPLADPDEVPVGHVIGLHEGDDSRAKPTGNIGQAIAPPHDVDLLAEGGGRWSRYRRRRDRSWRAGRCGRGSRRGG